MDVTAEWNVAVSLMVNALHQKLSRESMFLNMKKTIESEKTESNERIKKNSEINITK